MKSEAIVLISIIGTAIIVGLVLRFGATSVPLANTASSTILGGLQALTLANTATQNYPYEGPGGAG
jgi:hypothetical protein